MKSRYRSLALSSFLFVRHLFGNGFVANSRTLRSNRRLILLQLEQPKDAFQELNQLINTSPHADLLDLRGPIDGYRGVFVKQDVPSGQVILRIDLNKHCICDDDFLPDWFTLSNNDNNKNSIPSAAMSNEQTMYSQKWVVRLAAMLLDAYLSPATAKETAQQQQHQPLWFSLMPDTLLRSSLPIHWPEDAVSATQCQQLELAVDSMFFSRQETIEVLWSELRAGRTQQVNLQWLEDVLDLVQTRVCRLSSDDNKATVRCLAPVFDCINHHGRNANCEFGVDDEDPAFLIVKTARDLKANEEVFINYGSSSTQPAWKCLLSYGFFEPDEDDLVPVEFPSGSYALGRTGVPPELMDPPTPTKARHLCSVLQEKLDTMSDYALPSMDQDSISTQLAVSLKNHHQSILQDCVSNLEEWAIKNDVVKEQQQ